MKPLRWTTNTQITNMMRLEEAQCSLRSLIHPSV
jgi:hypothetical protein